jgi:elongation factor G
MAFRIASRQAMRQGIAKADAVLLEPYMKVELKLQMNTKVLLLVTFLQDVGLSKVLKLVTGGETIVNAQVPLSEMFGYITDLRSGTAGKATYSMEFAEYKECPANIQAEVIKARKLW